ncbi:peptidoglycan-binding domain-containing protein [Phaeovulum sp. W22_SRMD_FR3]|uniref:peptidoglycan-binding domain-containing protein n=1 Tax=Phaeovulum sp. W22_SRMD_FR3 TaxID=3240274 RepID=UPI003F95B368
MRKLTVAGQKLRAGVGVSGRHRAARWGQGSGALGAGVLALLLAPMAAAEDRALVIGNARYADAPRVAAAEDALDAVAPLTAAGFTVVSGGDLSGEAMRALAGKLLAPEARPGRRVILLSGYFAQNAAGTQSWFLGTPAAEPNLLDVAAGGLDLSVVLTLAGQAPGGAVVLIGAGEREMALGAGLRPGLGTLSIPQGVTVIEGAPAAIAKLARGALGQRGVSLPALAATDPGLRISGFVAPMVAFRPQAAAGAAPAPAPTPPPAALPPEPEAALATGEADEIALTLGREQRREIQRGLTLIGYSTKGIDGLFGPGTRAAIRSWQVKNGYAATGYLQGAQVREIADQAEVKAAALEAEAQKRQEEQDRQDRAYWDVTGSKGDEAGLRAYVKKYPDGVYAEIAQERLKVFDDQRAAASAEKDRAAWAKAEQANSEAGYRAYLKDFPKGAYAETAQSRLGQSDAATAAAERGEAALGLSGQTRLIVEQRLAAQGLKPGKVDGVFDAETRRAIRRYQNARGLPVSGYLNEGTVVRLLADAVLGGN